MGSIASLSFRAQQSGVEKTPGEKVSCCDERQWYHGGEEIIGEQFPIEMKDNSDMAGRKL